MFDLKLIRETPDFFDSGWKRRGLPPQTPKIIEMDEKRRKLMTKSQELQSKRNDASKQIGAIKSKGGDAAALMQEVASYKERGAALEEEANKLSDELNDLLSGLPNIPDERIPSGGKENNRVVKTYGEKPVLPKNARDHVQLCTDLGLVDYERGVKLGGSGFWLYKGMGAALEWALLNYFCMQHYKDGYQFFLPPHMLVHECGYAAGQFPKFKDDVFHVQTVEGERERFLLPTSETAILNVYRDEIIDEGALPIKAFAYSPCYRREAGSHRTEERGTVRGHQFNKVEMFQFTKPEQGEEGLNELVRRAEKLMEDLGLHYQTTLLAAEDVSASMSMTYDIEVWIPSMNIYKEVSSASWCKDYQARRSKIRFKRKGEKNTEFVHTLNASGLATSRLLPAIVEQNQLEDGNVKVPKPLQQWLGVDIIKAAT